MSAATTRGGFVRRFLTALGLIALGGAGLYIYLKYVVYAGPTLAFHRHGQDYELLAPRMLGIALLAPYFLWVIGRSLADLPPVQRVISALLRIAFVVLLALGLSRLARTATTEKVCTVYLVDVSDSVPDLAIEDARAVIGTGLKARGERRPGAGGHLRPPPAPGGDGRRCQGRAAASASRRTSRGQCGPGCKRRDGDGGRRGHRSRERPRAGLRLVPRRLPAPRGAPLRRRADRRRHPLRGGARASLRRRGVDHPLQAPRPR